MEKKLDFIIHTFYNQHQGIVFTFYIFIHNITSLNIFTGHHTRLLIRFLVSFQYFLNAAKSLF